MTEILHEIALTGGPVEIRGALEVVKTDAGVLPRRLPEWTRPQHQDPGMELMATSADTVREGHPDTPIVVVSPIACPESESVPPNNGAGTLTLQLVRSELRRVVAVRAQSDPALFYLDGLELLGPDEAGLLPDGLHPNQAGNDLIGERFATAVWGAGGVLGPRGAGVTRPRDSGEFLGAR